jgi:hypothetical protein
MKNNLVNLVKKAFFIDSAIVTKTDSWFLLQNSINHILSWQTFTNKSREVLEELYGNNSEIIEHILKCGSKIDKDTNYENQLLRNHIYSIKEDKLLFICELVTNLLNERNAITIKIENDVWNETLSGNTIKKLLPSTVKMPYSAFILDVTNYNWTYCNEKVKTIHFSKFNENEKYIKEKNIHGMFVLIIYTDDPTANVIYLDPNKSLEEHVQMGYDFKDADDIEYLLSRLFSVAMYLENFKLDKSRVIVGKQIVKKNKKRNILSDKQITVIKLKQPISNEITQREGLEKSKINVSFLVKGHWRNQSYVNSETQERYNKLKWIDSYFKGKDKDKLQKIIEI